LSCKPQWIGDPDELIGSIGLPPDGVIEAKHPLTGELRRTVCIQTPVA
jgi:hypothetical protein